MASSTMRIAGLMLMFNIVIALATGIYRSPDAFDERYYLFSIKETTDHLATLGAEQRQEGIVNQIAGFVGDATTVVGNTINMGYRLMRVFILGFMPITLPPQTSTFKRILSHGIQTLHYFLTLITCILMWQVFKARKTD